MSTGLSIATLFAPQARTLLELQNRFFGISTSLFYQPAIIHSLWHAKG